MPLFVPEKADRRPHRRAGAGPGPGGFVGAASYRDCRGSRPGGSPPPIMVMMHLPAGGRRPRRHSLRLASVRVGARPGGADRHGARPGGTDDLEFCSGGAEFRTRTVSLVVQATPNLMRKVGAAGHKIYIYGTRDVWKIAAIGFLCSCIMPVIAQVPVNYECEFGLDEIDCAHNSMISSKWLEEQARLKSLHPTNSGHFTWEIVITATGQR
jgi:hypothetical protein